MEPWKLPYARRVDLHSSSMVHLLFLRWTSTLMLECIGSLIAENVQSIKLEQAVEGRVRPRVSVAR